MKPSLFVRSLTRWERHRLQSGLRSGAAFTLRRCQILLASAQGQTPQQLARNLGCAPSSVRHVIHAFHKEAPDCPRAKPPAPTPPKPTLGAAHAEPLKALRHQAPRTLGKDPSLWSLPLVATVCFERGWTPRPLSGEAIRQALMRFGIRWKRAKHWITSPDPAYARKKKARDRLIRLAERRSDWVLGWLDETWWSRLAQPDLRAWAADVPLRLVQEEAAKGAPDPRALGCYGLLRDDTGQMLLRFVRGRPVSQVTEDFLAWVCARLAAEGKRALLLVWDNAPWHNSQRVRQWIKAHNRLVKRQGGVRIVACYLPSKSPWLNPIEPKWLHGKRAIAEPDGVLTAREIQGRGCQHSQCDLLDPIEQKVAGPGTRSLGHLASVWECLASIESETGGPCHFRDLARSEGVPAAWACGRSYDSGKTCGRSGR